MHYEALDSGDFGVLEEQRAVEAEEEIEDFKTTYRAVTA